MAKTFSTWLICLLLNVVFHSTYVTPVNLSYKLPANEEACFFTYVSQTPKKIWFFFAVSSGGSFDIDFVVTDPKQRTLFSGEKERQGDFVFNGNDIGEYKFCFSNKMSTFAEKIVDFEIIQEGEKAQHPSGRDGSQSVEDSTLDAMYRISGGLSKISRLQKYFKVRESRNFATVESTENRIFYFSLFESMLMVGMSLLQVYIVRTFFRTTKGRI